MPNEQQDSLTQSIQTILLIVIESFLTLILRFDSQLRQSAYPLALNGTVLAVRSYLPHDEIYVTFSFKGLLIDSEMPAHKARPDVIINAHSFEIVNAIISDKPQVVNKLQFRGEDTQVGLVKVFLMDLSVNQLLNNTINRFLKKQGKKTNRSADDSADTSSNNTSSNDINSSNINSGDIDNSTHSNNSSGSNSSSSNANQARAKAKAKKEDLKQKLIMLREEKNQLTIINKKQGTQLVELASRKKFFSVLAVMTFTLGLVIGFFICWLVL